MLLYELIEEQSSTISKTGGTFPWFQSVFVYFLDNIVFSVTANGFLEIFVAFESCNCFVLKIDSLTDSDSIFQFFRIILLMFSKNRFKLKIDNNKLTAIQEHLSCCIYSPSYQYFSILTRERNDFNGEPTNCT